MWPAGTLAADPGDATCAGPPAADTGAGPAETGVLDAPVVELRGCAGGGATGGGNTEPVPKPALNPREKSDEVAAPGAPPPPAAADGRPPAAGDTEDGSDDDSPALEDNELGDRPPVPADDNPLADGGLNPLPTEPSDEASPLPPDDTGVIGGVIAGVFDSHRGKLLASAGVPFSASVVSAFPPGVSPGSPEPVPVSPGVFPGSEAPGVSLPESVAPSLGRSSRGWPDSFHLGRSLVGRDGGGEPCGLSSAWMLSPLPPVWVVWSAGVIWPPPGIWLEGVPPMLAACSAIDAAVSVPTASASPCAAVMTASIAA
ncbi:Uncharacterised protein [Mycolicibacterium gilvum]|uniref:Uncharacterized protein n=1 Tax=Mycolicibacterium gilvum TaxID=1804 RepID=A0A379MLZ3_9MYCO|nr:Uncharacterised protein [Mycolicibacterium gilvum]